MGTDYQWFQVDKSKCVDRYYFEEITLPRAYAMKNSNRYYSAFALLLVSLNQSGQAGELFSGDLSLEGGYREDNLDWSIGSNEIAKLSELSYKDIEIYEAVTRFTGTLNQGPLAGLYGEAEFRWGSIEDGNETDSDWENPDNPSQKTNFSHSDVKGDDTFDYQLAIGYEFALSDSGIMLTPLVGYSYHEQNLEIGGGATTLASKFDEGGKYLESVDVNFPLPSKSAEYDTEWDGFWGGLEFGYSFGKNDISIRAIYQDYDYSGEANWILVEELQHPKSFTHDADGDGYKIDAKYQRRIGERWGIVSSLYYLNMETDDGTEIDYLADGTTLRQNFNGADWDSYSISVGAYYEF